MAKPKLVGLDLYFLKNWVREAPNHSRALAFFISSGFTPVIPPIVDAAIRELQDNRHNADTQALAHPIREEVDDSIIEVLSYERDIDRDANQINGARVADKGILDGAITADTIMLAEVAFFDVYALLTPRTCFTGAARESLKVALVDCGFSQSLVVFSPKEIGDYLDGRDKRIADAKSRDR